MAQPAQVVRLELILDGDSPTGSAFGAGGLQRRFVGWLGLVSAVEALVGDGPDGGPAPAADPTPRPESPRDGARP